MTSLCRIIQRASTQSERVVVRVCVCVCVCLCVCLCGCDIDVGRSAPTLLSCPATRSPAALCRVRLFIQSLYGRRWRPVHSSPAAYSMSTARSAILVCRRRDVTLLGAHQQQQQHGAAVLALCVCVYVRPWSLRRRAVVDAINAAASAAAAVIPHHSMSASSCRLAGVCLFAASRRAAVVRTAFTGLISRSVQLTSSTSTRHCRTIVLRWRRGVVVTELIVSTKLLYVEPG